MTVVSTISSQPPMIADELRRQADVFIDLMELRSKVGRDLSERPPLPERAVPRPAGQQLQRRASAIRAPGESDDVNP